MKLSLLASAVTGISFISPAVAHPGMLKAFAGIKARASDSDEFDSKELIGDLATLDDSKLTPVGRSVKNIIIGDENPESNDSYFTSFLPKKGSPNCARDTCCIWRHIAKDMEKVFRGNAGRCTNLARGSVRLGFHDAAGWSKTTGPLGGADGSIALADVEMTRGDNAGLGETVAQMKIWYNQYKQYGASMADIIQMSATVATVVCPLGPRIRSFVGRKDSSVPCPDHLLPKVTDSADVLIDLFANKTIGPHGLTALIGAHTTSQQRFVDPSRAGDPQDSTPGVWDVLFYKQTLGNAPPRVFKFLSDIVLARDPRIADEFREFAGPGGQEHWNEDYAREYVRLSLLGVYNINQLTECTKVLPPAIKSFRASDQIVVDKWLQSHDKVDSIKDRLMNGDLIGNITRPVDESRQRGRW